MATKKDINRKSFAFVRFKKANDELELEKALHGITLGNRILDVNIARFERRQVGGSTRTGNEMNRHLNRFTQATKFMTKDKRTFVEVATSGSKSFSIHPPPPTMECDPIKLFDASPLRGWMKCKHTLIGELHSFDHLEKTPYSFKNNDGSNCDIKYFGLNIMDRFMNESSRNAFMNGLME
ncbi:unnamed protein product [Lactuca saligna]|uniref:RRM domain-containing protein n=1 Tax=Lactuca saligna TaxID=75948 RepID=A0AA35VNC1_LACSI|nr:unnamed protein product [Lactuca saligna]